MSRNRQGPHRALKVRSSWRLTGEGEVWKPSLFFCSRNVAGSSTPRSIHLVTQRPQEVQGNRRPADSPISKLLCHASYEQSAVRDLFHFVSSRVDHPVRVSLENIFRRLVIQIAAIRDEPRCNR